MQPEITESLCLNFIWHHPVAFRDFFIPQSWGKPVPFKTRLHQMPMALCKTKVIKSGRGIGKSIEAEVEGLHKAVTKPNCETVISSFRRVHTKDRCESIIKYAISCPYLSHFIDYKRVNRTPIYNIPFKNGHIIYGASVGDDPNATAILGKHPAVRIIDEMQVYPRLAWTQLNEARAETGSEDIFIGVPNGIIGMPFTDIQKNKDYKHCFFRLSRKVNPYWNQKRKQEAVLVYGGEDSDDYKQQILGEDGSPVQGAWDMSKVSAQMEDSVERYYHEIRPSDYKDCNPEDLLFDLPVTDYEVNLGIDAGYTEPTQICIFEENPKGHKLIGRICLRDKVIFDDQEELIDYIASFYGAHIGIDTTSAEGREIADALINPKGKYAEKDYINRIIAVYFNSKVVKAYDNDNNEIEEEVKPFTTFWLTREFNKESFILPYDDEILKEFSQEKKRRTPSGNYTYITPGTDHIISAFRCYGLLKFLENGPHRETNVGYCMPSFGQGVMYGSKA